MTSSSILPFRWQTLGQLRLLQRCAVMLAKKLARLGVDQIETRLTLCNGRRACSVTL